ncbi:hypothetical protein B0I35DRAFT_454763 [Stachybotrys elegans]|uniref:FAD-binding PCMH-type domain-containing protein n=1 Tax=Stachybotrys elegans TaxID=80388 RepID=A0A8K0WJG5_9HYPO|nr:hypothetical protein B0I35DRAFT_454763 [Stachybotrys elegans]
MVTNEQCTLSATLEQGVIINGTCHQGTVPDYYIDARDVKDIQLGLTFARQHKIPISVKNTGHDYKGRSTGPDTLAIWTKNIMPDLKIDKDFVPQGCEQSAGPGVTYGAGQTFDDLYTKLDGTGYFIVGGSCTTVGAAGGWLAGGGNSILTPILGLGVDNALQIKAVLPNGTYITANRCQNQDLFFAMRGGGGGTFGVVTEVTSKLHEDHQFIHVFMTMNLPDGVREVSEILVDNAERWADEGWGGIYGGSPGGVSFLTFNPSLSLEEAENSVKPLRDYLESVASDSNPLTINITTVPSHWAVVNTPVSLAFIALEAGTSRTRSSRLVPRENFQTAEGRKQLVDVIEGMNWATILGTPTAFALPESDLPGGPGYASVTPAWRNALWHFIYTESWDQGNPAETSPEALEQRFRRVSQAMDPMRAITPGAGAYQAESDIYEPDMIDSFWGQDNYDRLLKIKQDLDPDNLLSCFTCVGWDKADPRHRCYPEMSAIRQD